MLRGCRLTGLIAGLALILALAGTALAHDGWVQAYSPIVPIGEDAYVDLLFGNHANGHKSYRIASKWNLDESRVFVVSPDGSERDITARAFDTGEDAEAVSPKGVKGYYAAAFVPDRPGLYLVSVRGDSRFQHGGTTVRTLRSAKAFVAAAEVPLRTRVAAMTGYDRQVTPDRAELVPLFNPAAVTPGTQLAFQLFLKGKPAGDQHVAVIRRSDSAGADYRTDAQGRIAFEAGAPDYYLVRAKVETDEKEAGKYDKTAYEATMTFVVQRAGTPETQAGHGLEAGQPQAHTHDQGMHGQEGADAHAAHGAEPRAAAPAMAGLRIQVNGQPLSTAWEIRNGRVYVPVSDLAAALGLAVYFDPQEPGHGLMLERKGLYIHLHMNQNDAHVGGRTVQLDAPAAYMTGQTVMVPVRFVAETYGGEVAYRPATPDSPATVLVTLVP